VTFRDETVLLGDRPVHRIGFGAMQLPGPGVFGPPPDRDAAIAVLRRAVELGVDHIDTAQFYGPDVANELIHDALHPYPDHLVLVSKVGARRDAHGGWIGAQAPEELRSAVVDNLRSLDVERVDVVNLRRHDAGEVSLDEQVDAMVALRDEGLIGAIGVSNVDLEQFAAVTRRTEVACVQNPYNLADRSSEAVLAACIEQGVPFVPFFPLGSAFASDNPVLGAPAIREVAGRLGATPAQVALAWLLSRSPQLLLIPGTSSPAHLEDNLAAADLNLGEEDRSRLDAAGDVATS